MRSNSGRSLRLQPIANAMAQATIARRRTRRCYVSGGSPGDLGGVPPLPVPVPVPPSGSTQSQSCESETASESTSLSLPSPESLATHVVDSLVLVDELSPQPPPSPDALPDS